MNLQELIANNSRKEIHEKTGLSLSHITSIKTGKVTPGIEVYTKICVALGVDPKKLLVNESYYTKELK